MKIGKIMLKCLPNSAHLKSCDSMKTFETVRNGWRAEDVVIFRVVFCMCIFSEPNCANTSLQI